MRWASRPGPSRPRISHRSAATDALATQLAARSITAPAAKAAKVPAKVARGSAPNGVSAATGCNRTPGGWLRNRCHQNGYVILTGPNTARKTA